MPKASVIIPVYNAEKYLGECLDSVLGQTLKDIEVICVDDGSTDGSAAILADYAAKDARMKVLHRRRLGAGAARNIGLAEARGDYLFFCDSDDWIDHAALCELCREADVCGADVIATGMRYFDSATGGEIRVWHVGKEALAQAQPFGPEVLGPLLFAALRVQMGGKMFRRRFIEGLGISFQEQPRVNDLSFVATAIAMAGRILADGKARYHYRKNHGGNLSSRINEMPEMAALAWLRVKENLESRGAFGRFRRPFARSASQALVNSLLAMTDAPAAERYYGRITGELVPALDLRAEDAAEDALPFFSGGCALDMFMRRLAVERENHRRVRERLVECSAELAGIKGSRSWRAVSLLKRAFGMGGR